MRHAFAIPSVMRTHQFTGGLGNKTAEAVMLAGDPREIERMATMVFPE